MGYRALGIEEHMGLRRIQGNKQQMARSGYGLPFEIQFHTPDSWEAKQQTHDAYERINDSATHAAETSERLRAYQQTIASSSTYQPDGKQSELSQGRLVSDDRTKSSYYSIVGVGRSVENPSGLARRTLYRTTQLTSHLTPRLHLGSYDSRDRTGGTGIFAGELWSRSVRGEAEALIERFRQKWA